jgi:hypothetical protein
MKKSNIEIGLKVQYKGGDEQEHVSKEGDIGLISSLNHGGIYDCFVDFNRGPKMVPFFAKYLRIVAKKPKNTVAGYQAPSGNVDPKAALAAQLVILPETNKYISASNRIINKWVNGDGEFVDIYNTWSAMLFHGRLPVYEYRKKSMLAMDYIIENKLV